MIINKETSKKIFTVLNKMKEISGTNLTQQELDNYFHTINVINTLERDTNIVGNSTLSKYRILTKFQPLILPAEITVSNDTKQVNMLSDKYYEYTPEQYFGRELEMVNPDTGKKEKQVVVDVKLLPPTDFNVLNDAIVGMFKKTADLGDIEPMKITSSIDAYVGREMHDGKCVPKPSDYVPVELNVNIARTNYLTEDAVEQLVLWFEGIFRSYKGKGNVPTP